VLRSLLPREKMLAKVAAICQKQFAFKKAIFAPTLQEWIALIENNPFPKALNAPNFLHAALLADRPRSTNVNALKAFAKPEEGFAIVGNVAYLHTPSGFGASKLAAKFDKGIGVASTVRNWNTVRKLRALAERAVGQ
jgi:uncharacterized protein (DUF1697 family)